MTKPRDSYNELPSDDPSIIANAMLNAAMGHTAEDEIVILDEKIKAREESKLNAATLLPDVMELPPRTIKAADARSAAPVLQIFSDRDTTRLLILTRNISMRELGSLSQKHLLELGQVFGEIHVIMLNEREEETVATVRLSDNIWLYSTESTSWWRTPFDAYRIAKEQIAFAGGFRADIVIAEDPFESGVAGYFIAKEFKRSFQIHILEDIYEPSFEDRDEHNPLRLLVSRFVLKRIRCVRTQGEFVKAAVLEEHPNLEGLIDVLPTYYNLRAWRDMVPTFDLKDRYPHFKFIILHVSSMQARSHTSEVIASVAGILHQYPTIGLVIVGNGPLRSSIEKQVITLGIQNQVEFEPTPSEVISHMKTANVLVHLSEDSEEDVFVLQAATVKLPMVASLSSVANAIFIDGESAFLCNSTDTISVAKYINIFLNDNQIRSQIALNAQDAVFERIAQDYDAYLHAYRNSVERCME